MGATHPLTFHSACGSSVGAVRFMPLQIYPSPSASLLQKSAGQLATLLLLMLTLRSEAQRQQKQR